MILPRSRGGKVGFAGFFLYFFYDIIYFMNGKRLTKQIIYGSGYAAILFFILFGIYNTFIKPAPTCSDGKQNQSETSIDCGGPCPACEIRELFNLKVDQNQIKYFPADPDKKTTAFYFELKNLNINYGADFFYYYLDLYNKVDLEFVHIAEISQIYAGGINHIVAIADVPYDSITKVLVSTTDINWKIKSEFPQPSVRLREVKTSTAKDGGVIVTGFAQNNEAFVLSKILISSVIANPNGIKIGASKTELENIPAFSEKAFKINFPKTISLSDSKNDLIYYDFQQDLTLGSTGDDVKKLQELLRGEGFSINVASGDFDQTTKTALMQYQQKAKISPTSGKLDVKTREYINALKKIMPAPLTQLIDITKADSTKTEVFAQGIK